MARKYYKDAVEELAKKEKQREERTESRKAQRKVKKEKLTEEQEYNKSRAKILKNWNHNTMKGYPPTWEEFKSRGITFNAKGGSVNSRAIAKKYFKGGMV